MGVFGKAHGIKGELALVWYGQSPPEQGAILYLGSGLKPVALKNMRLHNGRMLVTLEGVQDRTGAEALSGQTVSIRRKDLPPLAEDEVYLADLVGARILLDGGHQLGLLDHVEFPAGREVWSILTPNGKEVLFPARPEFIAAIDQAAREIVIAPPPGLLEIYNA